MQTSIYIANSELQAVMGSAGRGRVRVSEYESVPLPAGTMVNGVITDEEALKDAIEALRRKNPRIHMKKVRLTVGSSLVYSKRMPAPPLPDKKLLAAARGEFSGMEDAATLVYDTARLYPGKDGATMLVTAVKRELLENYIRLFHSAGVELESINTILGAENKLTTLLPQLRESNFITIVLDGSNMDAVLYIRGSYRLSHRLRLMAERGSAAIGQEIQRTVSSLLQFNTAEKSGEQIIDVYFAGLEPGEEAVCRELEAALNLRSHALADKNGAVQAPAAFDLGRFIYPLGNLIPAKSDVNFLSRLGDDEKRDRNRRNALLAALPLVLTALILGAVAGGQAYKLYQQKAEQAALESYVYDPENLEDYARAGLLTIQRNAQAAARSDLEKNLQAAAGYPSLNAYLFRSILECTGENYSVSAYAYSQETGVLTLSAAAASEMYMPELVLRLRNTGLFLDMGYSGYTSDNDGLFHATISCLLMPEN